MRSNVFVTGVLLGLWACSSGGGGLGVADGGAPATSDEAGTSTEGKLGDAGASKPDETETVDPPATTYKNVTIDFDDVDPSTVLESGYSEYATFTSDPGCACEASNSGSMAASDPNYLLTYFSCDTGPTASVFIDFKKPVRNLRFKTIGVNSNGKAATVKVSAASGTDSIDIVGEGSWSKPVPIDLSMHQDVTRVEIVDIDDTAGLGFDDFTFDFPDS